MNIWLRDNCHCPECYNSETYQRLLDTFSVSTPFITIKVKISNPPCFEIPDDIHVKDVKQSAKGIEVAWSDNHNSIYNTQWLSDHTRGVTKSELTKKDLFPNQVLWSTDIIKNQIPTVEYKDVLSKKSKDFYNNIHKYGFSFIDNVPVSAEDTEKLCGSIGYIRVTHYGGFWDFTTDLAMKDTAYSEIEIPSHTDGTYWEYTPYLQLFHLLFHDGEGGNTTLVDAFKCAEDMKREYPDHYKFLSTQKVDCHSLGDVYLAQSKRIFIHNDEGELIQVSWNNSDRSSNFDASNKDLQMFYQSIKIWNEIIHRDENVLNHRLKPGQALIFDNWRCLHARIGITTGKRRMCGAYFDKEDFQSTLRMVNTDSQQKLFESL